MARSIRHYADYHNATAPPSHVTRHCTAPALQCVAAPTVDDVNDVVFVYTSLCAHGDTTLQLTLLLHFVMHNRSSPPSNTPQRTAAIRSTVPRRLKCSAGTAADKVMAGA